MRLVKSYIKKWQGSPRFATGRRARDQRWGIRAKIAEEFINQNLPPQFFYLAMQESDFDEVTSGPPTRWGIAKGMWQFIPETAKRYGLKVGPLADVPSPTPRRPARLGEGDQGGGTVHQGHLFDRRAGVGPAGDGLVQLGREPGHQPAAKHAGQPGGAQLLEGARASPRQGPQGDLRLRASTSSRLR